MKNRNRAIAAAALLILALAGAAVFIRPRLLNITFGISDYFRDRGLTDPEDIVRIDNQRYGDAGDQVFDVYYPAGTEGSLPAIVSIHGGGYTYGTKETYQYYCMNLAEHGFAVVNFSYRLAPEYRFPAQLEDTNAVLAAVCGRAGEYHIDTDNIFFVGDSAGGHLNAQYSAAVTNPEYAELLGLEIPDFTLRATALNCGVFAEEDAFAGQMGQVLERAPEEYGGRLDILGHITEDFPPSFIMSSTGDMCLPYAGPMYEYLTEKGVEAELHVYGDENNKLPHVFHVDIRDPDAARCSSEECAFFREHIGPGEEP